MRDEARGPGGVGGSSNVDTRLADDAGTWQDRRCHAYDYTNGNDEKHVLMLELGASW